MNISLISLKFSSFSLMMCLIDKIIFLILEGGQIIRMHLKQYKKTHCILIYKDLAGLNIRNDQDNTGINIFDRPLHRQYVQERQKCYTTQRF